MIRSDLSPCDSSLALRLISLLTFILGNSAPRDGPVSKLCSLYLRGYTAVWICGVATFLINIDEWLAPSRITFFRSVIWHPGYLENPRAFLVSSGGLLSCMILAHGSPSGIFLAALISAHMTINELSVLRLPLTRHTGPWLQRAVCMSLTFWALS